MQKVIVELATKNGSIIKINIIGNVLHIYHNNDYYGIISADDIIDCCRKKSMKNLSDRE